MIDCGQSRKIRCSDTNIDKKKLFVVASKPQIKLRDTNGHDCARAMCILVERRESLAEKKMLINNAIARTTVEFTGTRGLGSDNQNER